MKEIGTVDYTNPIPPDGYQCEFCHTHGVKLWRRGASSCIELHCLSCANQKQNTQAVPSEDGKGVVVDNRICTDQIGYLVPAVPVPEGDTCWGYTSVPQDACDWWYRLPYSGEDARRIRQSMGG